MKAEILSQICFIDPAYDPNVSTFKPLLQHVGSNERVSTNFILIYVRIVRTVHVQSRNGKF